MQRAVPGGAALCMPGRMRISGAVIAGIRSQADVPASCCRPLPTEGPARRRSLESPGQVQDRGRLCVRQHRLKAKPAPRPSRRAEILPAAAPWRIFRVFFVGGCGVQPLCHSRRVTCHETQRAAVRRPLPDRCPSRGGVSSPVGAGTPGSRSDRPRPRRHAWRVATAADAPAPGAVDAPGAQPARARLFRLAGRSSG